MATIRRKRKGWQVLIRKKFAKQIIKTFVYEIDPDYPGTMITVLIPITFPSKLNREKNINVENL
jgi:hypothetical protein